MTMKKVILTLVVFSVLMGWTQEYEWIGGATGSWMTAGNWEPNGTPGAGDSAKFLTTAEITDGFIINSGTLTIFVDAGKTLKLSGDILGAGGIAKTGAGVIDLWGNNTFTGGLVAGTSTTASTVSVAYGGRSAITCAADAGLVALGNGAGLGNGKATIYTGFLVRGGITITAPIEMGGGSGACWLCQVGEGDVTFNETFKVLCSIPIYGEQATVYFKKKFFCDSSAGSPWLSNTGGGGCSLIFEDEVDTGNVNYSLGNSNLEFRGTSVKFCNLRIYRRAAFTQTDSIQGIVYITPYSKNAVLDLCGHDQHISTNSRLICPTDGTKGYRIHSDTPAQLVLTDLFEVKETFYGQFTGFAGLHFGNKYSHTFIIAEYEQPTCGTVSVSGNCIVELTEGATFTKLGKLELQDTAGGLKMTSTAGDLYVNELILTGGKQNRLHDLNAGKIFCRKMKYGDEYLSDGRYSKPQNADPVEDFDGRIYVESSRPVQWVSAGGNWSDGNNWETGVPPSAGQWISVTSGTITQDVASAELAGFEMANATLVMTGWDTALNADTIRIGSGAKVTCIGAFTTEAAKARVLINCYDLTIAENGCIDVDKAGWSCGVYTAGATDANGYGPGGGISGFGAAYGGPGGHNADLIGESIPQGYTYGSAAEPVDPGSGGYQHFKNLAASEAKMSNTHGGGAVRINAEGTVTVDGTITANGGDVRCAGGTTIRWRYLDTAGSGGSIWISCDKFAGNGGVLRAEGGAGCDPRFPEWQFGSDKKGLDKPGGGGRIAIQYNVDDQSDATVSSMTISARGGLYTGTAYPLTYATQDKFRNSAELGTIWFTDAQLLDSTVGEGLSGQVVNPVGYAKTGDLNWTEGWVRFAGEGAAVSISGNLTISGAQARLEVGGIAYTSDPNDVSLSGVIPGEVPYSLTVGGAMTVANGGRFDVRASETNGDDVVWGATVNVGGKLLVNDGGVIAPWCAIHNLGSPRFLVGGDFEVAAGGTITADERGGSGANPANGTTVPGAGPGHGLKFGGASHGGVGGIALSRSGSAAPTYDDIYHPTMPGSGGGGWNYWGLSSNGGGVVHVSAAGAVIVNGTISANGGCPQTENTSRDGLEYLNCGSGGTVYLWGQTFSGAGTITAKGGNGRKLVVSGTMVAQGTGGGGCVAIWTGENYKNEFIKPIKSLLPTPACAGFTGEISVAGGAHVYAYNATDADKAEVDPDQSLGSAGTITYANAVTRSGLLIMFK